MCKLYALQTRMTKAHARKIIADRSKTILKTESNGMGIALNVDGITRIWQCGESFSDAVGDDVTEGLDSTPKMATLMIHGRTSTSLDRSVDHSHPRPTKSGPLIHNGVVIPKDKSGWKMDYALDSDYLGELVDRDELHLAARYLNGYAGVMLLKDDGTLIVQNQGASLHVTIHGHAIEFGTTQSLCTAGSKFELMRAELNSCSISIGPIEPMGGRVVKYDQITNIGVLGEKKVQSSMTFATGLGTPAMKSSSGRTKLEMGPNPKKKGKIADSPLIDSDLDISDIPEYMSKWEERGLTAGERMARDDFFSDWKANTCEIGS